LSTFLKLSKVMERHCVNQGVFVPAVIGLLCQLTDFVDHRRESPGSIIGKLQDGGPFMHGSRPTTQRVPSSFNRQAAGTSKQTSSASSSRMMRTGCGRCPKPSY